MAGKSGDRLQSNLSRWVSEHRNDPAWNLAANALDMLIGFGSTFIPNLDTTVIGWLEGTQNYTAKQLERLNQAFIKAYERVPNADSSALTRAQSKLQQAQDAYRRSTFGSAHYRKQAVDKAEEAVNTATSTYDQALAKREKAIYDINNKYNSAQQIISNPNIQGNTQVNEIIKGLNTRVEEQV